MDNSWFKYTFVSNLCSNDPHFYQACDKRLGGKITNNEVLCENYLCLDNLGYMYTPLVLFDFGIMCTTECVNTELNKEKCNDEMVALPSGKLVRPSHICNDVCDLSSCEDEANCNGYHYGKYCIKKKHEETTLS